VLIHLKEQYSSQIKQWLNSNTGVLVDFEVQHIERLCQYLDNVETSYEDNDTLIDKHNDLFKFVNEYARRQHINIEDIYQGDFIAWLATLKK